MGNPMSFPMSLLGKIPPWVPAILFSVDQVALRDAAAHAQRIATVPSDSAAWHGLVRAAPPLLRSVADACEAYLASRAKV